MLWEILWVLWLGVSPLLCGVAWGSQPCSPESTFAWLFHSLGKDFEQIWSWGNCSLVFFLCFSSPFATLEVDILFEILSRVVSLEILPCVLNLAKSKVNQYLNPVNSFFVRMPIPHGRFCIKKKVRMRDFKLKKYLKVSAWDFSPSCYHGNLCHHVSSVLCTSARATCAERAFGPWGLMSSILGSTPVSPPWEPLHPGCSR